MRTYGHFESVASPTSDDIADRMGGARRVKRVGREPAQAFSYRYPSPPTLGSEPGG